MPPKSPKDVNVTASLPIPGMKAKRVEYEAEEDKEEKAQRLHKELVGFYAKDLSVWILAPLFIVGAWFFCIWIIVSSGSSAIEKERAWTAFMAITTGAIGVFFGKQIGK
jgi:hypothetical protein